MKEYELKRKFINDELCAIAPNGDIIPIEKFKPEEIESLRHEHEIMQYEMQFDEIFEALQRISPFDKRYEETVRSLHELENKMRILTATAVSETFKPAREVVSLAELRRAV